MVKQFFFNYVYFIDFFLDCYANIEHDSIATKYGLPYDIIQCACYLKEEIFGSVEKSQKSIQTLCVYQSCCNFAKLYGKSKTVAKYTEEAKNTKDFKQACKTYNDLKKKAKEIIDEEEFSSAEAFMKVYYPFYWRHIFRNEALYLYDYDRTKEKFSKTQVIRSCMTLLREQNLLSTHYQMKMKGLEDGVKFNDRMNHNFTIACSFLKKEYPSLFAYLMKKYRFRDLHCRKLEIIRNRLKLIKRARMSNRQLKRLNEKYKRAYMNQH